jgi:hypothetical protein
MGRYINTLIEKRVQVLDSSGDPATLATVLYRLYDETGTVVDSGAMAHVANGIFRASFTPDVLGTWIMEAYSTNPKFHDSTSYNVEWGADWVATDDSLTYGSLAVKTTLFELTQPSILESILIGQTNDEVAAKNIDVWITQDDEHYDGTIDVDSGFPVNLIHTAGGVIQTTDISTWGAFNTLKLDGGDYGAFIVPDPGCSYLKIEAQMTSGAGTSQAIQIDLVFRTKGLYTPD